MASNGTIAHRFANKDYNFEKGLKGSSTHIDGRNYYSYSTVFGQWVDEKVCLVFHGETSITSHKHMLWSSNFPKDVVLLPYDDGGGYYSWHGCDLLGYNDKFTFEHRVKLIDYYVGTIFDAISNIMGGKKKNLDTDAQDITNRYWHYVMTLCAMYRDTTISKWLKITRGSEKVWTLKRKLVRELDAQNLDVTKIVDVLFGEGTYKAYYDYCARYRQAANKRAKIEALCHRLGIGSPYVQYRAYRSMMSHEMTADQIRKLTAKERVELHFKALAYQEDMERDVERRDKYMKNFRNAYKWIVGSEPKQSYGGYDKSINNCINKDNGVVYECSGNYIRGFHWLRIYVSFDYEKFRKSDDKEQWIADFYAKCKEVALNRKAALILQRIKAHTKEKVHSYDDDIYVNDDYLRENTTEAEYNLCVELIRKQDKHFADKEARERAARIEIERKIEEERKERELQKQLKQEQIDECLQRGLEGRRDLWRQHYMAIYEAESYNDSRDDSEFFFGGNVLLRFSMNKDKIESSKSIRMTIATAKAMWKIVSKWHNNPSSFKPMNIKTLDGTYTISSYEDDILTAGCHDIAYAEMEHMYNEIVKLENEAA